MSQIDPKLKEKLNMMIALSGLDEALKHTEAHPEAQELIRRARAWVEDGAPMTVAEAKNVAERMNEYAQQGVKFERDEAGVWTAPPPAGYGNGGP